MSFLLSREERSKGIALPKRSPLAIYNRKVAAKLPSAPSLSRTALEDISLGLQQVHQAAEQLPEIPVPNASEVLESFREHLQVALMIELSTIPLYLYPYYSIKDSNDPAASTIRGDIAPLPVYHCFLIPLSLQKLPSKRCSI